MAKRNVIHSLNVTSIRNEDKAKLYEYICHIVLLDGLQTNKSVNSKYSISIDSDIHVFIQDKDLYSKNLYLTSSNVSSSPSYLFYYKKNNTKVLSFLKHIRNSIAHDNISYDPTCDRFHILDYEIDNGAYKLTAEGYIMRDTLIQIMEYVINNIR